MYETSQIEHFIRALRGVIRKFSSDKQTTPFKINVVIRAISVRKKDIGLQSVQTDKKVKQAPKKIQVKIRVIIVKKNDIGLQNTLKQQTQEDEDMGSDQEEEEVPSPKEEPRYIQKSK